MYKSNSHGICVGKYCTTMKIRAKIAMFYLSLFLSVKSLMHSNAPSTWCLILFTKRRQAREEKKATIPLKIRKRNKLILYNTLHIGKARITRKSSDNNKQQTNWDCRAGNNSTATQKRAQQQILKFGYSMETLSIASRFAGWL